MLRFHQRHGGAKRGDCLRVCVRARACGCVLGGCAANGRVDCEDEKGAFPPHEKHAGFLVHVGTVCQLDPKVVGSLIFRYSLY